MLSQATQAPVTTPPAEGKLTAMVVAPTAPAGQAPAPCVAPDLATGLEDAAARDLIAWALRRWGERLVICTSFQLTGAVILDIAARITTNLHVMTLDTGRLPGETYDLIERVRQRYGIVVDIRCPDGDELAQLVRAHGPNLFYRCEADRRACCHVRKVLPLRRALRGYDAWITGLRRDQSPLRAAVPKAQVDEANGGLIKLNPLADWSEQQVWSYVRRENLPYHALYDHGYRSIGCAPCTRAVGAGESARDGRWWWEQCASKECGLHLRQGTGS